MEFIEAKSIVNKGAGNSWFGIDYNMNIYKGCSHGCIYCDSRSDCYGIEDFDTVRGKKNAIEIIHKELKGKRKSGIVGTGAMSDPYNPMERTYTLTRQALMQVHEHGFGITIATKSDLIVRDIDILKQIAVHSPVLAKITITSSDDNISKIVEPHVNPSSKRFDAIKELSAQGIYTGILLMPVLPYIEDNQENILSIIQKAHESGAKFIYPAFGVTLRQNQKLHYLNELEKHYKGLAVKYQKVYGNNYECTSPNARELYHIFTKECQKYGILYKMKDIIDAYKNPYKQEQLSFF